ncbi:hypothetical protein [uncultured Paracoccus sp.]|uniref:hypothetical protein n=1 Tax=uncultured Paracoccus sp. TaxID=189685 RepID=UPI00260A59EC|nr:hypothetical protein [uncultured Paracoccus sp.]
MSVDISFPFPVLDGLADLAPAIPRLHWRCAGHVLSLAARAACRTICRMTVHSQRKILPNKKQSFISMQFPFP